MGEQHDDQDDDLDDDLERHAVEGDPDAASRARSAELLQPRTPEEVAEHEERARRNRLERIMAPSPPPPPVIVKIRPDALRDASPGNDGLPGSGAGVVARIARRATTPRSEEKLVQWWAERLATLWGKLHGVGSHEMAHELLRELAGADVAAFRRQGASDAAARKRHRKLKKRLAVLEEQAAVAFAPDTKPRSEGKPRVRIASGRQPVH